MNIHEYQAKEILRSFDLPVPKGITITNDKFKINHLHTLSGPPWVIKSQIHAGGRGAGYFTGQDQSKGGVRIVNNIDELRAEVQSMLGNTLVTKQTGPQGKVVNKIYIEEGCVVEKEFYLSILIDRKVSKIMLMVSESGGVNIEKVAIQNPKKILTYHIEDFDFNKNIKNDLLLLAQKLSFNLEQQKEFIIIVKKLLKVFVTLDASTIEINPLVLNKEGSLFLLDAKIVFDDNALFRQPEIIKLKDESEEDPAELLASKNHMNYVKLTGNIGCMVNGAGLAMATMDIIKKFGSEPANFLDLGGTADKARAIEGFKIILSDPNVRAILINIFGGIIRCDMIAEGIISAAKEINLELPVVVRFQGTNAQEGRDVINSSKLNIIAAGTLNDAAEKAVEASLK
ncbi:MAG: Succinyl-CoA ligase [ADP-forming] subunit beta [Alphaproteobacteria bacterium MarineAlpha5_Bin11]|nr:ADP-forming succinate--CoA ligase subunit beta [Pelagibacteraceae bacterium]PPR43473.1 MAG: Succinyl-CoA ligase [ADP-forming] subunit beta [Alphaproteobacteria bacterium MarineAlpha5_Bin11]PPR51429.1 MAG: Succinyl-CoA ligase [ADP-forming] subunit beta [Alphaproteobacteria bacterium MarineAlpha5_Bin10]|tara:strand:+ start:9968 stop:11164 length:1197 start_codon:yes stop_codon:yes gene_type:complete